MRRILSVALVLSLVSAVGCYKREIVPGPEYVLYVFAEESDWQELRELFSRVFQREIMTPQMESHFRIKHVSSDSVGFYLPHKHLLFAASLESQGEIADIVNRSIKNPESLEKVQKADNFLFRNHDQWAKDQIILTMVSTSIPKLKELIEKNQDFIYRQFREHQRESTKAFLYRRMENTDLSQELMDKYQWQIRVQHDYGLALEDSAGKFIFLRRRYPERWLFVKWFDGMDPGKINEKWYFDLRDSIGVWYYGGDTVNREYTKSQEINFLDRWCLKVEGLWKNDEKVAGGPLLAYIFYDEGTRRTYIIDCAVFAPSEVKIPYLDQLDIMANTFITRLDRQREEAGG